MHNARQRYHGLATALLLLVVGWAVGMYSLLDQAAVVAGPWRWVLTLLSSGAVYRGLLSSAQYAICHSETLLAFYWGEKLYWKGYWHYTSIRDGQNYLGVWRIDQDIHGTSIAAFGLDAEYRHRFSAYSVGDPMPIGRSVSPLASSR